MNTLNLIQGTKEWADFRAKHFTASDAAAMMGMSKYKTRAELLREKATGIIPEVDAATQARFDRGHAIEALARPFAEALIGEELFPVVLSAEVDGLPLSASLDGLTMAEDIAWECKTMNQELADSLDNGNIPISYWPQMEQGLLLSGADRCVFTASDGTEEGTIYVWYDSKPELRKQIIAGWKQFAADLDNYKPEHITPEVIGYEQETLPALFVQVEGRVVAGDIKAYKAHVDAWVDALPAVFETDQDFADGAKAVKACAEAEDNLKALTQQIRGQMADVDTVFRLLEESGAVIRDARLRIDAAVKANSKRIREQAVMNAGIAFRDHVASLTARIGDQMPFIPADFGAAIKGLKSVKSMNDAIGSALARAKIEANQIADTIQENRRYLIADGQDWIFLFPDFRQCCTKAPEDFANLLMHRINEHKQRESAKLEAERERIRREESERITREAARADLQAKAQAAQEAREAEQRGKTTEATHAQSNATDAPQAPAASTPPIDDGKRLKLGELKAILAPISIDADGLAQLGIHPAGTEKAAKLYRAADVPAICRAIIGHLNAVIVRQ